MNRKNGAQVGGRGTVWLEVGLGIILVGVGSVLLAEGLSLGFMLSVIGICLATIGTYLILRKVLTRK